MQLPLIILILGGLVVGAAGLHSVLFATCAIIAAGATLLVRPPTAATARGLWFAGMAFFLWTACTLLPLPAMVYGIAGEQRQAHFKQAEQASFQLLAIREMQNLPASGEAEVSENNKGVTRRLSLNPSGTLCFLLLAIGAWAMFWLTATAGDEGKRRLLKIITGGGATIVLGSMVFGHACFEWTTGIFPWRTATVDGIGAGYEGLTTWPFTNRNHFATFAAMLAPAAFCLAIAPRPVEQSVLPRRLAARFMWERMAWFTVFSILATGVVLTQSVGGTSALLVAMLATTAFWLRRHHKLALTFATVMGIIVLLALTLAPSERIIRRLRDAGKDPAAAASSRLPLWKGAIAQWKAFPVAGGGMESVRVLGNVYKVGTEEESPIYSHNEYLQLLADGGIVIFAIVVCMVVFYGRQLVVRWRCNKDRADRGPPDILLLAAAGTGIVLLCHFMVEYPCRVPLNAFLAAVMLGLGFSLGDKTGVAHPHAWRMASFGGALILLLLVLGAANTIGGEGRLHTRTRWIQQASVGELAKTLKQEPSYWLTWYEMGIKSRDVATGKTTQEEAFTCRPRTGWITQLFTREHTAQETPSGKKGQPLPPNLRKLWLTLSCDCFRQAAACNPHMSQLWFSLGCVELETGNPDAARQAFLRTAELAPARKPEIEKLLKHSQDRKFR